MSLTKDESGKLFGYNVEFDMSQNTALALKVTDPEGVETEITPGRISVPIIDGVFEENGEDKTYLANEYMQFITEATDFTKIGVWAICGVFTNTTTTPNQVYHGTTVTFEVLEDC